jgi:mono/diheme cytochrome c family protein
LKLKERCGPAIPPRFPDFIPHLHLIRTAPDGPWQSHVKSFRFLTLSLAALFLGSGHAGAAPEDDAGAVRRAPIVASREDRADLLVGGLLPHLSYVDEQGKTQEIETGRHKATVIVVRDIDCPVSRKYAPRLKSIQEEFAVPAGDVAFICLFTGTAHSVEEMRQDMTDGGHGGVLARDPEGKLARALRLRTTSEVFVIDHANSLRYRGAIDDQYGIGYQKNTAEHPYLRDALREVLANAAVTVPATSSPGCVAEQAESTGADSRSVGAITYHNRVSRIIQNNCQACHHQGGAGPFPLETYAQVMAKRKTIRLVVEDQIMPPWGAKHEPGKWLNDMTLGQKDEDDLLAWIKSGTPEGDPKDAAQPLEWPTGWKIGKPDLVLQIPQPIQIPAEGEVKYQYVKIRNPLKEGRWIKAMELKPTAPQVVHHALVFRAGEARGGGLQGYFMGLVPGETTSVFDEGFGKFLPAGEELIVQLHYTANGKATSDQIQLGFVFYDEKPAHEIYTLAAGTTKFVIPPGASRHQVVADYEVKIPGTIISFAPHTHLRGKAFRYDLIYPDGHSQELIDIPRYDFNWQMRYRLAQPVFAPLGSKIRATAWYDNSAANPANPDPTKEVRFGDQTWEEMMIGYFEAYIGK